MILWVALSLIYKLYENYPEESNKTTRTLKSNLLHILCTTLRFWSCLKLGEIYI